ncbi:MAG TPA: hypothetical protein VFP46_02265 [Candidatus Paceibacterota bacterium]|nr:hypothetical protein [Candidatus Paceibacterota bacterium]
MTTGILLGLSLLAVFFFPWPFAAVLAIAASLSEPLIAFAVGVFADAVYYSIHAARVPYFTVGGALVSIVIVFVRSRLKSSPVR